MEKRRAEFKGEATRMFKQATVEDVANKRITRLHGRIVVTTHYYPRFLKSNLIHDYMKSLAPTRDLLTEFKEAEDRVGHDEAFLAVDYENRFWLSDEGLTDLQALAIEALDKTIYLVCHCPVGQKCHRELLMVMAEKLFGAPIGRLSFDWKTFRSRVEFV